MGAEAGRDEEARDGGLAEAELVVGRESLRAVHHPPDARDGEVRHAALRVDQDLVEPVQVLREQAAVEVRGNRVVPGGGGREGSGVALVPAQDEPVHLLPVVHEQVGVPKARQSRGGQLPGGRDDRGHRLGHHVLVRHRHDRHPDADHARHLGRVHAPAVHDDLALDVAPVRAHPRDPALLAVPARGHRVDGQHAGPSGDPDAARACPGRQRVGELRRVDLAVRRQEAAAVHAVEVGEREQPGDVVRPDLLQRQPGRARPAHLPPDLLEPLAGGRDLQAAALDPPRGAFTGLQTPVQLDAVSVHPGQGGVRAQLTHEPGGVERGAGRELGALDEQDVPLPEGREVVGDARAAHAAAHDDDARAGRQLGHARTVEARVTPATGSGRGSWAGLASGSRRSMISAPGCAASGGCVTNLPAAAAADAFPGGGTPQDLARLRAVPAVRLRSSAGAGPAGRPHQPHPASHSRRRGTIRRPAVEARRVPALRRPRCRGARQPCGRPRRRRARRRRPGRGRARRHRCPRRPLAARPDLDGARPGGRGQPGPARRHLPAPARRAAIRPGLRHVRGAAALPGDRAGTGPPAYPRGTRNTCRPPRRSGERSRLGRCRRFPATTTCCPPTCWTTATGSGSSTTSTPATGTPSSSSGTRGARPPCRRGCWNRWSPPTWAGPPRRWWRGPDCSA